MYNTCTLNKEKMHRVFFVKYKEKNISKPITPKRINLVFKWKKIKKKN